MLSLGASHRYWLYAGAADMRKGFDGLCGLVNQELEGDPLSGDVFIFVNRSRNRMKLLLWEEGGLVVWYKRLERGTFELPQPAAGSVSVGIKWRDLMLIIEGVKLFSVQRRKRYSLEKRD
ncbi:MAG: IS66 family insertion sequence element accessory protein TnpB [Bacteroidota bacterium]